MSVILLKGHSMLDHPHDIPDDLESIFWLLCYCLLRYTNICPGSDEETCVYLHEVFDETRGGMGQDKTQISKREGGGRKRALLFDLHMARSPYMQPPTIGNPLNKFIIIVSELLMYHIKVEDELCVVNAVTRKGIPQAGPEKRKLDMAQRALEDLRGAPPAGDVCWHYRSLRAACVEALAAMRAYESSDAFSDASKPPSAGSLRVKDRFKAKMDV